MKYALRLDNPYHPDHGHYFVPRGFTPDLRDASKFSTRDEASHVRGTLGPIGNLCDVVMIDEPRPEVGSCLAILLPLLIFLGLVAFFLWPETPQ